MLTTTGQGILRHYVEMFEHQCYYAYEQIFKQIHQTSWGLGM